jgi:hypothetical protein
MEPSVGCAFALITILGTSDHHHLEIRDHHRLECPISAMPHAAGTLCTYKESWADKARRREACTPGGTQEIST